MDTQHLHSSQLTRLSDTDLIPAATDQDIRNRKVVDRHGKDIGDVDDLFVDEQEQKVRMLQIRAGGFLGLGERHFLLPVEAITEITENAVHVNVTLVHVIGSPVYDPALVLAPTDNVWGPYYGYYGLAPNWESGQIYPTYPQSHEEAVRRLSFAPII